MKKDFNSARPSGSEKNEPKVIGEVLNEYLQSNEPLAAAFPGRFHRNTELAVDLKLLSHQPGRMPVGAYYDGVLRRDSEMHFTFIQTSAHCRKRNPHVFEGRYITVTRRDDGSPRLNFKELKLEHDFSVVRYALGVYRELRQALKGLVEEG